ncbi:hypothetical protein BJ138DRAFT_1192966 [Hygrophoropsis aurantiaca]|uniref:Uncharacterized protein n=1 Tax=Hygrophoropsis aurantiaca TaxID=72124 RepID=A0ACB7ZQY5_9AGAM|nr:hypothetical protein BJ138DRAFT_1192966 [Hygrophoropsis aurantiaca]
MVIRRNLGAMNEPADNRPPAKAVEEKPRPFRTEDIDALRKGSSWLTSDASSRHDSCSNWSFSTHQTHHHRSSMRLNPAAVSQQSLVPKSSYWFNPPNSAHAQDSDIPLVPPLPSPHRPSSSPTCCGGLRDDPDPFRRGVSQLGCLLAPHHFTLCAGILTSQMLSRSASSINLRTFDSFATRRSHLREGEVPSSWSCASGITTKILRRSWPTGMESATTSDDGMSEWKFFMPD